MIVRVDGQHLSAQIDYPNPQRLVRGNPQRRTWPAYESGDGVCAAGIWACEPGAWRIAFADNKEEIIFIRHGRVQLIAENGHAEAFGPGLHHGQGLGMAVFIDEEQVALGLGHALGQGHGFRRRSGFVE